VLYMASITQRESPWPPASKINQCKLLSIIWQANDFYEYILFLGSNLINLSWLCSCYKKFDCQYI
jgi:hypothetical protein